MNNSKMFVSTTYVPGRSKARTRVLVFVSALLLPAIAVVFLYRFFDKPPVAAKHIELNRIPLHVDETKSVSNPQPGEPAIEPARPDEEKAVQSKEPVLVRKPSAKERKDVNTGRLSLSVYQPKGKKKSWARVFWGGRLLGKTPLRGVEMPAGTHRLRLENKKLGMKKTIFVAIRKGKVTKSAVSLDF